MEAHIYGPPEVLALPDTAVLALAVSDILQAYPELRGHLLHTTVQRNPATHTRFETGADARYPGVESPWPAIGMCGDWLRYPHPALFLERACITGIAAADRASQALGGAPCPIVPARPPSRSPGRSSAACAACAAWCAARAGCAGVPRLPLIAEAPQVIKYTCGSRASCRGATYSNGGTPMRTLRTLSLLALLVAVLLTPIAARAADPRLTPQTSGVTAGESIRFSAEGFSPKERIVFWATAPNQAVLSGDYVTADRDGSADHAPCAG